MFKVKQNNGDQITIKELEEISQKSGEAAASKVLSDFSKELNERAGTGKVSEILKKATEANSAVPCPTCHTHDHQHILRPTNKGTLKCSGDDCGEEFVLLPKAPDYKCTNCGTVHKKPAEAKDDDRCVFCNGDDFIELKKFEKDRLAGVIQKKKGLFK